MIEDEDEGEGEDEVLSEGEGEDEGPILAILLIDPGLQSTPRPGHLSPFFVFKRIEYY